MRKFFFHGGPAFSLRNLRRLGRLDAQPRSRLHIPVGKLEPYAFLGGGFAKLAYHRTADGATGFDVRFGAGLVYYVSNVFSVEGRLDVDLLSLSHSIAIDSLRTPLTFGWSSLGLVITPGVVAGLHF